MRYILENKEEKDEITPPTVLPFLRKRIMLIIGGRDFVESLSLLPKHGNHGNKMEGSDCTGVSR
jgi:hypothetical protein